MERNTNNPRHNATYTHRLAWAAVAIWVLAITGCVIAAARYQSNPEVMIDIPMSAMLAFFGVIVTPFGGALLGWAATGRRASTESGALLTAGMAISAAIALTVAVVLLTTGN